MPLKLFESFGSTTQDHFAVLSKWLSDLDKAAFSKLVSSLVSNENQNVSIGCLKQMRKALQASKRMDMKSICQKLRASQDWTQLKDYRLKILEGEGAAKPAVCGLYDLAEGAKNASIESFELLGKRIVENSAGFEDNIDKIIPIFTHAMHLDVDDSRLNFVMKDLRDLVNKYGSSN